MLHINRFIDRIKSLEAKQAKTLTMTLREAKDLHGDITKVLLLLEEVRSQNTPEDDTPQIVEINGGKF